MFEVLKMFNYYIHPESVLTSNTIFLQYFADAAEANSWLNDRKPLLTDEDYGKDEISTIALLQRHQRLEKEMGAYTSEVKRLGEQAQSAAQLSPLTVSNNHHHRVKQLLKKK